MRYTAMKKTIISFLITACLAGSVCLAACDPVEGGTNGGGDDPFDALNTMLEADYAGIDVTVTDTFDEGVLTSVYNVTFAENAVQVAYAVERFTELSLEGSPSSEKQSLTGEVLFAEGGVTLLNGDDIGLTAADFEGGLRFKEEYFSNPDFTGIYLISEVKDPDAFFGRKGYKDMRVNATFLETFYDIEISCTSPLGSEVLIEYTFKY